MTSSNWIYTHTGTSSNFRRSFSNAQSMRRPCATSNVRYAQFARTVCMFWGVVFNFIGKIINHKGYDISRIINFIPFLYETSLLGWSEPEIQRKEHKYHPNIKAYHNYINKFSDRNGEYFIRFTIREEKAKKNKNRKKLFIFSFYKRHIRI